VGLPGGIRTPGNGPVRSVGKFDDRYQAIRKGMMMRIHDDSCCRPWQASRAFITDNGCWFIHSPLGGR
jgi:hypothetical protein